MVQRRFLLLILLILCFGVGVFLTNQPPQPHQKRTISLSIPDKTPSKIEFKEPINDKTSIKSGYQLWLEAELVDKPVVERFYKVDMGGQLLPNDASHWVCVYDHFSGLLWEVKQNDGGWQDKEHTYSWYEPPSEQDANSELTTAAHNTVESSNSPEYGLADSGSCYDIQCDTHSYKVAVNEEWLCSSNDWRLPYAHELGLLDHPVNYYPDIDTQYFPNTALNIYWSRTEVPSIKTLAWSVNFDNGFPYITEKRLDYAVRLVTESPWLAEELNKQKKGVNN